MSRPWTLPEMEAQNRLGRQPVTVPLDMYLRTLHDLDTCRRELDRANLAVRRLSCWLGDASAEITRLRAAQGDR